MKKLLLTIGIIIIFISSTYSQVEDKTITLNKKRYYQSGQKLNGKQLKTILSTNPASQAEYSIYHTHNSVAAPFLLGGSACMLVSSAIMLSSSIKQSNDLANGVYSESYPSGFGLLGIGLASITVGLIISLPATKHFKKSVDQYNSSLTKTGYNPVQVNMKFYANGIGIKVVF